MPSYIELNENASFPAASGPGKVILGVNTSGSLTLTNDSGSTTPVGGGTLPYAVYTALLNQENNDPISAVVLQNTMGGNVTVEENSPGVYGSYKITLPITYVSEKLWVSIASNNNASDVLFQYYGAWPSGSTDNVVYLNSYSTPWNIAGNSMYNIPIEIRIYP